ncbi:MAG: hypothetical protein K2Q26_01515 [Bdellovibrionales bacterium]|nr:hypothetical protein [Bdellovibrionales bacterium]
MSVSKKIKFKYTMMFQTSSFEFDFKEKDGIVSGRCEAQIKLPILKQSAFFATEYSREKDQWLVHAPMHTSPESAQPQENNTPVTADTIDPISLFLAIDEGRWQGDTARIFWGGEKSLTLKITQKDSEYILERPSKNQTLYVGVDGQGISYFKVKVPVLGDIKITRV